jgi:hypothetical protein
MTAISPLTLAIKLTKTKTLLEAEVGVIDTLKPVTAVYAVEVVLKVVGKLVDTTCKIRKPPRKSFICVLVRTCPTVNAAGSVVGVAISLLL